ncbi:MAG: UvrB/UvrC motif-containing protein [Gemmataceae bacterium]
MTKCQRCPKQATLHITEVLGDDRVDVLHLCEECAKKYLHDPAPASAPAAKGGKPAVQPVPADDPGGKQCEACGIKFVEFRNSGRLGCPHDYDAFREELLPLLDSIHGDVRHAGKTPRRKPKPAAQLQLAQLRKKLQQAVAAEKYEDAARLRDQIRQAEEG